MTTSNLSSNGGSKGSTNAVEGEPPPHYLSFSSLSLTASVVDPKTKSTTEKPILKNLNGVIRPGRLCALMSASGGGKTSLLNCLSFRSADLISGAPLTANGDVRLNGQKVNVTQMKSLSSYVFQDDVILDSMTVREAIYMAAALKMPRESTEDEKRQRVSVVLEMLHLEKCADTIVGNAIQKGISGGEKRRLTCAIALVTNPPILFLDEPVTGIDAFVAFELISILQSLCANHHRTILCSIHSPPSDIFYLFSDLLLLSEGEIVYFGPVDQSVAYFSRLGYPCPQYSNPADFFFSNVLNVEFVEKKKKREMEKGKDRGLFASGMSSEERELRAVEADKRERERLDSLLKGWKESAECKQIVADISSCEQSSTYVVPSESALSSVPASFTTQVWLLSLRAWRNQLRNQNIVPARFGQTIAVNLIIGLVYISLGHSQSNIQDREGSLFFLAVNTMMSASMQVQNTFHVERTVFLREYQNGFYGLIPYFFSRMLVEMPFRVFFPLLGAVVNYFLIGYQVGIQFLLFVIIMIVLDTCGALLGILITCIFPIFEVAVAVAPLITMPMFMFSGYFVNASTIPPYFNWISYISPSKYAYEALIKNEFSGLSFYCTPSELVTDNNVTYCPYLSGDAVITNLGFDSEPSIGADIGILLALSFGMMMLALGFLWNSVRRKTFK